MTWFWRIAGAIALTAIGLAVWATAIEPGRLIVRNHALSLAKWPPALSGYRIAVLTDLHVGSPHIDIDRLAEIVARTNAEQPDLIVLAGDYVIDEVIGGTKTDITAIAPVCVRAFWKIRQVCKITSCWNWPWAKPFPVATSNRWPKP